jgi:hypothetical protein
MHKLIVQSRSLVNSGGIDGADPMMPSALCRSKTG